MPPAAPSTAATLIAIAAVSTFVAAPVRRSARNGACRRRGAGRSRYRLGSRSRYVFRFLDLARNRDGNLAHNDGNRRHRTIQLEDLLLHASHNLVVFVVVFEEIRNVEKRVPLQADIDKSRLHARQHARYATLMNASSERVFVLALIENLDYLILFEDRHAGFVAVG